jgi:hypothetical protein
MLAAVAQRTCGPRLLQACSTAFRQLASAAQPAEVDPSYAAAQEFRENVAEFARKVIAPHAEHVDRNNDFPTSVNLWREMGDFGLLGRGPSICSRCGPNRWPQQLSLEHRIRRDHRTRGLRRHGDGLHRALYCHGGEGSSSKTTGCLTPLDAHTQQQTGVVQTHNVRALGASRHLIQPVVCWVICGRRSKRGCCSGGAPTAACR